jgi:hypothetical protein
VLRRFGTWAVFAWLAGAILAPATAFGSFGSAGAWQGSLPEIPLVSAQAPIRADVSHAREGRGTEKEEGQVK